MACFLFSSARYPVLAEAHFVDQASLTFMVVLLLLPLVVCDNPFATEMIGVHHNTHQCVPCLYTRLHIDFFSKSVSGHLLVLKMILFSSKIG